MRTFLIFAALLVAAGIASAQFRRSACGKCAPVGVPGQVQYEWRTRDDDADRLYLYANGVQMGGWDYTRRTYRAFDARSRSWGPEEDCAPAGVPERALDGAGRGALPKEMPKRSPSCDCGCTICSTKCACAGGHCEAPGCRCQATEPIFEQIQIAPREQHAGEVIEHGRSNFGIDLKAMEKECPQCACNDCKCDGGKENCQCHHVYRDHRGCPITRAKAFEALANGLPDDSAFLRVTFVGPADQAAVAQKALASAGWADKVCFQNYANCDDPILKDTATGEGLGCAPGLMIQSPAGVPLWYAASLPTPDVLNKGLLLADARRKDPKWDPSHWPALAIEPAPPSPAPGPASAPDMATKCLGFCQNNWGWMAGAGAVAYLLRRKKSA